MKKKFCFVFLILACFVLAGFGGIFSDVAFAEEPVPTAAGTGELVIEGNDAAATFKNLFNDNLFDNYATITLNCDITLTEPLTSTLGTESTPFSGVFNGRGHTISGLNIDGSSTLTYAGLFGVTEGATIKNLKLAGNISLQTKPGYAGYMGAVVGLAKNTTIENVSVDATSVNFNTNFDKNLSVGLLAGGMVSSSAKKVICRTTNSLGNFQINDSRNKEIAFGGIVGKLTSSQIHSSIVQTSMSITLGVEFNGDIKFGGVVGQTCDGTTQIINVAENNTLNFTNNSMSEFVKAGEVVGEISSPAPNQDGYINNISYIHYKDNANITVFGDQGGYDYKDTTDKNCNITANQNNSFNTKEYYTNTFLWNTDYIGIWDFDNDWNVASGRIENQAFLENLTVQLSANFNEDVLTYKSLKINDKTLTGAEGNPPELADTEFRYGDKIEIEFSFTQKDFVLDDTGAKSTQRIIDFYNLRELQLASNFDISSTYRGTIEMDMAENNQINDIRLTSDGSEGYTIAPTSEVDGFVLTIEKLSIYSSGSYNISMEAKTFTATLTSRLYKADNEMVVGSAPGYIYNAKGTPTTRTAWQADMSYQAEYIPEAHTEPIKPYYVFDGWYVVVDGADDKKLSSDKDIKLELGVQNRVENSIGEEYYYITGNVEIYAKYSERSRQIYFSIDSSSSSSGVEKVVVVGSTNSANQTLDYSTYLSATTDDKRSIYIDGEEVTMTIDIYIKKGYEFDTEFFKDNNTIQSEKPCTLEDTLIIDDFTVYRFKIEGLKSGDEDVDGKTQYATITIKIITKAESEGNNMMMWIIIGCVAGALLLIGLVVLIIFLVKRRSGGGGGKNIRSKKTPVKNSYKSSKKDFKQMYF